MPTALETLYELQSIDLRFLEKNREIERFEAELAQRKRTLAACNARLEELTNARKRLVAERALIERSVNVQREQLNARRSRLTRVRTERELRAGEHEVKAAAEEITAEEEKLLEVMTQVEEFEGQIAAVRKEQSALEEADHLQVKEAAERINALKRELDEQRGERDALAGEVDARVRQQYDMVLSRRGGLAVVVVNGGSCGGCHMTVPHQTLNEIMESGAVRVCPSCQRILYVKPPSE